MDYKDTVMKDKQMAEVVLKECDVIIDVSDIDRTIASEQAKISWDAAIREVVERVETNNYNLVSPMMITTREWKAQLKHWGITED